MLTGCLRLVVFREGRRDRFDDRIEPSAVRRVARQELGRLIALVGGGHVLPQIHCATRIEARLRHVHQALKVGLRLLSALERQLDADRRALANQVFLDAVAAEPSMISMSLRAPFLARSIT